MFFECVLFLSKCLSLKLITYKTENLAYIFEVSINYALHSYI